MIARVENNEVIEIMENLPDSIDLLDGRTVTGFKNADPQYQIECGFYPIDYLPYTCTDLQKVGSISYAIDGDTVIGNYSIIAKTNNELQQEQNIIIQKLTISIQRYLDDTAKTRNYDGILSLCTYASSMHSKFQSEGIAGVIWRDEVWDKCYQIMEDVLAGNRAIPTTSEIIEELPVFTWGE